MLDKRENTVRWERYSCEEEKKSLALEENREEGLLKIDIGSSREVFESDFCDDEGLVELRAEEC